MALMAGEIVAQHAALLEEIQYSGLEQIDVERLGDICVRAGLDAGDVVLFAGLAGKHHERDVIEIDVLAYLVAQGQTVHDRHHDIADYDVRSLLEHGVQRLFSVGALDDVEVTRKFGSHIAAKLLVIVHKHQTILGPRGVTRDFRDDYGFRQYSPAGFACFWRRRKTGAMRVYR